MYFSNNSRCVLRKARFLSPNYFNKLGKSLSVKKPKDDPTKPPLRVNIPDDDKEDLLMKTKSVIEVKKGTQLTSYQDDVFRKADEMHFSKGDPFLGDDMINTACTKGSQTLDSDSYSYNTVSLDPTTNSSDGVNFDYLNNSYSNVTSASNKKTETSEEPIDQKSWFILLDVDPKNKEMDVLNGKAFAKEKSNRMQQGSFKMSEARKPESFSQKSEHASKFTMNKSDKKRHRFEVHEVEDEATYILYVRLNRQLHKKPCEVGCVPEKEFTIRTRFNHDHLNEHDVELKTHSALDKERKRQKYRKKEQELDFETSLFDEYKDPKRNVKKAKEILLSDFEIAATDSANTFSTHFQSSNPESSASEAYAKSSQAEAISLNIESSKPEYSTAETKSSQAEIVSLNTESSKPEFSASEAQTKSSQAESVSLNTESSKPEYSTVETKSSQAESVSLNTVSSQPEFSASETKSSQAETVSWNAEISNPEFPVVEAQTFDSPQVNTYPKQDVKKTDKNYPVLSESVETNWGKSQDSQMSLSPEASSGETQKDYVDIYSAVKAPEMSKVETSAISSNSQASTMSLSAEDVITEIGKQDFFPKRKNATARNIETSSVNSKKGVAKQKNSKFPALSQEREVSKRIGNELTLPERSSYCNFNTQNQITRTVKPETEAATPKTEKDKKEYLNIHRDLKEKTENLPKNKKKSFDIWKASQTKSSTESSNSEVRDFQTCSSFVTIGRTESSSHSMTFGAAFPPLLKEALSTQLKLKNNIINDKWKVLSKEGSSLSECNMRNYAENSILFPKADPEDFDCESVFTTKEQIILKLIKIEEEKSMKSSEATTEAVDSLSVMKKVKEIVQLDLDNVVKIFDDGVDGKELSSVVVSTADGWKVNEKELESHMAKRKSKIKLELMNISNNILGNEKNIPPPKYLPSRKESEVEIHLPEEQTNSAIMFNPKSNEFFICKEILAEAISKKTKEPLAEITETLNLLAKSSRSVNDVKKGDSILVFDDETQSWKVDFSILEKRQQQLQLEEELTKTSELILETFEELEKNQVNVIPKPDTKEKKTFDYVKREWKDIKNPNGKSTKSKHPFKDADAEEIRKKNSDLFENLFVVKKKETKMKAPEKRAPGVDSSKKETKLADSGNKKESKSVDSGGKKESSGDKPEDSVTITKKPEMPQSGSKPPEEKKIPTKDDGNFWEEFLKMNILPKDISEIPQKSPPPPPVKEKKPQKKPEVPPVKPPPPPAAKQQTPATKKETEGESNQERQKKIPPPLPPPSGEKSKKPSVKAPPPSNQISIKDPKITDPPKQVNDPPKKDPPKLDISKQPPKVDPPKLDISKEPPKGDAPKLDITKIPPKVDPPKLDISRQLPGEPSKWDFFRLPRRGPPKPEIPKETPKVDPPKQDASTQSPKVDPTKEPPKGDPPKPDNSKPPPKLDPPNPPSKSEPPKQPPKSVPPKEPSNPVTSKPTSKVQDPKAPTGTKSASSPLDHYVSDKIIEISKLKGNEPPKTKSKIETVKLNITADTRLPSKITEINLSKKSEKGKETLKTKIGDKKPNDNIKTSNESAKQKPPLYKRFEKYQSPFSDPEYEEKSIKIKSDIASNPNLKKLDNWNKTLVLHDIMKPPENIETWLKDETDKMATLLLKILQDASDVKPKKKQLPAKPKQGKTNPYENIRKKQENTSESFLFRVRTVNLSLQNEDKKSQKDVKSINDKKEAEISQQPLKNTKPSASGDTGKLPLKKNSIIMATIPPNIKTYHLPETLDEAKDKIYQWGGESFGDFFPLDKEPPHHSKLIVDITEEIPGPEILKKISNLWKILPVLDSQLTVFTLLRVFQLVNLGRSFLSHQSSGKTKGTAFSKLFSKYGPVVNVKGPLSGNVILIHKPEHLAAVFEQDAPVFVRSVFDSLEHIRKDSEEKSFTTELSTNWGSPEYTELKRLTNDTLFRGCEKYMAPAEISVNYLIGIIRKNRNSQDLVSEDFMEEIKRWSLEGLCSVLFERSFGFLEGKLPNTNWALEPDKLFVAIEKATQFLNKCEGGFQLWRMMPTPSAACLSQAYNTVSAIFRKQIHQAELNLRKKNEVLKEGGGLFHVRDLTLIESMLLNDGLSSEDINCNLVDIMLIGTNMINSSVGFLLYNLALNMKAQSRLFQELKEALPNKSSHLDYSTLTSLKYLQACVKENFRLHMPVPLFYRMLQNDILLYNYYIPKGSYVVMDQRTSNQKEYVFENPDKFVPERWLSDERWMLEYETVASFPLCHGPRADFAKRVMELQLYTFVAKILRNFHIEYHYGEIQSTNTLINFPDKPLKLNFIERES